MKGEVLIRVQNLRVVFDVGDKQRTIIDDIDYVLHRGEVLGIVGESGSGKTQSVFAILGIENGTPGIVDGNVEIFLGKEGSIEHLEPLIRTTVKKRVDTGISVYSKNQYLWNKGLKRIYRTIRGKKVFLMFQDPKSYLNPFWTVEKHFKRVVPKEIQQKEGLDIIVMNALQKFGLYDYNQIKRKYPHALSGGMIQRVMIALGYACQPDIIIADEITTGLDVVNEKSVVIHLKRLIEDSGLKRNGALPAIILISHDLGFISKLADNIFVMYSGQGFEFGDAQTVLDPRAKQKHPYTKQLLEIYSQTHAKVYIEGDPPKLDNPPTGCRFHERCHEFKSNKDLQCDVTTPQDFSDLSVASYQIRCRLYE